ncbi:hypothetical protein ACLB2K_006139 [Fragaria x ananassa]
MAKPSLIIFVIVISSLPSFQSKPLPRFLGKFSRTSPHNSERRHQHSKPIQYETRYFPQNLDHFSFSDTPKLQQRYLVNSEHWVGPQRHGPIFLYCGNEGDILWFAENTGFVWDLAPRFGAMVLFPEHRYYGESMPFGSEEEAYKNASTLSFLTAEQALADFAVLITELKRNWSAEGCPVVLFGGSYGGMLAAWMRLKYPHIAIGALASSAPILQFEDIVPTETFYDIVSNDFRRESSSCFNTIKESWDALMTIGQKQNGLLELTKTFHLCRELKKTEDLADWLESAYSYLAMVCRRIDGCPDGTSTLERVFEGISVYYNYSGNADCFELEDTSDVGTDGWNWQACTEMVMPMSSSRDRSMFQTYDYNFSSFQDWCWKELNAKPRPTWITTEFGGHDIKATLKNLGSNIIFSNGLLDPWSGGSVLQNISQSIVALVTEEGAHHIDLRFSTKGDPDWLVEQRESEVKLIQGWLDEFYQEKKAAFDM